MEDEGQAGSMEAPETTESVIWSAWWSPGKGIRLSGDRLKSLCCLLQTGIPRCASGNADSKGWVGSQQALCGHSSLQCCPLGHKPGLLLIERV